MDEDVSIRAIIIGVSVLIAIATISAVMTYYSTAKELVRRIGSGTDIAGLYDKSVEDTLLKGKITGTELKNLLNYFYNRNDVEVNINSVKLLKNDGSQSFFTETSGLNNIASASNSNYNKIMKYILPNSRYAVATSVVDYKTIVTVTVE